MRVAVVLATALLAGCLQPSAPAAEPGATADPTFAFEGRGCDGVLMGLLVEPPRTDPYLPPGFHLRDPAEFFRDVPTGTGMALVVLAVTLCAGGTVGDATVPAFQEAFAGIFVLPPAVAGERPPAGYDFYEIDHFAPPGPLADALGSWGWRTWSANLTATLRGPPGNPQEAAVRADGPPRYFRFDGATPAPRDDGESLVRMWHDTAAGIGRVDRLLPLQYGFGPGTCSLAAPTRVAELLAGGPCAPVVAARQGFSYPATAVLEAGRHAL